MYGHGRGRNHSLDPTNLFGQFIESGFDLFFFGHGRVDPCDPRRLLLISDVLAISRLVVDADVRRKHRIGSVVCQCCFPAHWANQKLRLTELFEGQERLELVDLLLQPLLPALRCLQLKLQHPHEGVAGR